MKPSPRPHRFRVDDGNTPEFLAWSIDYACPLREPISDSTPQACAQYLRPLATIGFCQQHELVIDGVCIDPRRELVARGFFLDEVAEFYGGIQLCTQSCGGCPANQRRRSWEDFPPASADATASPLAGCFGWLRYDDNVVAQLDRVWNNMPNPPVVEFTTSPHWYSLWGSKVLAADRLQMVKNLFDNVARSNSIIDTKPRAELDDFCCALNACYENQLSMSVELVPRGKTIGTEWSIEPHCERCKSTLRDFSDRCRVCKSRKRAHPVIKRKRMGHRPFLDLEKLVGAERARQLIARLAPQDL